MYIGNGVTKNFPLPEGYDGSVVILRIPGGKGIRMTRGEGYEVKEGSVNFYAPVPSGVEVIFDELSVSEMMSKTAGNYVVIYGDGTTKEVSEDPVILLAEAQKVLNESKLRSDEVIQAGRETVSYITGLIGTLKADLEGRLDGYSLNAEEIALRAASEAKSQITRDWAGTLERISAETEAAREIRYNIERLLEDARQISVNAANVTRDEISKKCEQVLNGCEMLSTLRDELTELGKTLKQELERTYYNVSEKINVAVGEELEMLKSLRTKMEDDYKTFNAKINNRWEILSGEK